MIDVEWVEENIKDKDIREFVEAFIVEDYENVSELISTIIANTQTDIPERLDYVESFEDIDDIIDSLQLVSKTLKILDTFTE